MPTSEIKEHISAHVSTTVRPGQESQATIVVKPNTYSAKKTTDQLWSSQFLSNWFFLWVLPIISRARGAEKGIAADKVFDFSLRRGEEARVNADDLTAAWNEELNLSSR